MDINKKNAVIHGVVFTHQSSPPSEDAYPEVGKSRLFFDDVGTPQVQDSDGNVTELGGAGGGGAGTRYFETKGFVETVGASTSMYVAPSSGDVAWNEGSIWVSVDPDLFTAPVAGIYSFTIHFRIGAGAETENAQFSLEQYDSEGSLDSSIEDEVQIIYDGTGDNFLSGWSITRNIYLAENEWLKVKITNGIASSRTYAIDSITMLLVREVTL